MPELIVLCGVSHSGKSTHAQKLIQDNPHKQYLVVSSDEIRERLYGSRKPRSKREEEDGIWAIFGNTKIEGFKQDRNIILDACHISFYARRHARCVPPNYDLKIIVFPVPIYELERRVLAAKRIDFACVKEMVKEFKKWPTDRETLQKEGFKNIEYVYFEAPEVIDNSIPEDVVVLLQRFESSLRSGPGIMNQIGYDDYREGENEDFHHEVGVVNGIEHLRQLIAAKIGKERMEDETYKIWKKVRLS